MPPSTSSSSSSNSQGAESSGAGDASLTVISCNLERLLLEESASNESVFDWLDINVNESKRANDSQFIKTLAYTVFKASIGQSRSILPIQVKESTAVFITSTWIIQTKFDYNKALWFLFTHIIQVICII